MAKSAFNTLESLASCIDEIQNQKAHTRVLFEAFGPLMMERISFLASMEGEQTTFPVDSQRLEAGISLIQQNQLFLANDPWKQLAISAISAIFRGFPTLRDDMQRLKEQVDSDVVNFQDFFVQPASEETDLQVITWAVKCSVSAAAMELCLKAMERTLLSKRASDMKAIMMGLSWHRGYCPICSSMPMLAIIREQGQQWLQCSHCDHEWIYPRLTCPSCEHHSPDNTTYFYIETSPDEKAFVCEHCQKYLITVNQGGSLREQSPEVLAIGLTHLDIILQNKSYTPMATCEWNCL